MNNSHQNFRGGVVKEHQFRFVVVEESYIGLHTYEMWLGDKRLGFVGTRLYQGSEYIHFKMNGLLISFKG